MTSAEYRESREKLGLTQLALADSLGVTSRTISNRERGAKPITKEAEKAIKLMLKEKGLK